MEAVNVSLGEGAAVRILLKYSNSEACLEIVPESPYLKRSL